MKTTKENIQHTTTEIYNRIVGNKDLITSDRGGLLNNAGCTIFLYHYGDFFKSECAIDNANLFCEKILENIHFYQLQHPATISICSGILGSGWTLNYLKKEGFVDFGDELDKFDKVAEHFFYNSLRVGIYDYLHGALGALYYLLSLPKNTNREVMISKMLKEVISIGYKDDNLFFLNDYDLKEGRLNKGVINLGLSHGTPSLIPILCLAAKYSKEFEYLKTYIRQCANTIMNFQNVTENGSRYSYKRSVFDVNEDKTRLGWCYGDLGVGVSLLHAANLLGDETVMNHAIAVFKSSVKRRSLSDNQVKDAALCHGAAGISHLFFTAAFYTIDNKDLIEASKFWLETATNLISPFQSIVTGKTTYHLDQGYHNCFSLLEGLSGVGLAFLSQLSERKMTWHDILLLV